MNSAIEIFTDGACSGNPGPGAWAAYSASLGSISALGSSLTTNNAMELEALVQAVSWAPLGKDFTIYSDSRWAVNVANGLYVPQQKELAEIGIRLKEARTKRAVWTENIYIIWIPKGSHVENVIADKLAKEKLKPRLQQQRRVQSGL